MIGGVTLVYLIQHGEKEPLLCVCPEPRRCHIVVVRTTTTSHRRGCDRRAGDAGVTEVARVFLEVFGWAGINRDDVTT
jgi:hypothetical protein